MNKEDITVNELYAYAMAHNYIDVSAMVVVNIMMEERKHSSPHNIPTRINIPTGLIFKEYTTQDVMDLFSTLY